jgi:hypothetical protein
MSLEASMHKQPETTEFEKPRIAVEDKLKVKDFIERHIDGILDRIEHSYLNSKDEPAGHLTFIAECLPIVSFVVHVGSSRGDFKAATEWVHETLPDADPGSVLSALTFIYLVAQGRKRYSGNDETASVSEKEKRAKKRDNWEAIHARVQDLLDKPKD